MTNSKNNSFKANELHHVWALMIKSLSDSGQVILDGDTPMKEIRHVSFEVINSYDIDVAPYVKIVEGGYIENFKLLYAKNGTGWNGRNYGQLIYEWNGIDQVEKVISILNADEYTKSANIILADGTKHKSPCVMMVNFSKRNMSLDMCVVFKSSDVLKKFIPDINSLSEMHKEVSNSLKVGRGVICGYIASAQLHLSDEKIAKDIILHSEEYKDADYFPNVEKNWDDEALSWDKSLSDQDHYVNFQNGYNRYLDRLSNILCMIEAGETVLDLGSGTGFIAETVEAHGLICDTLDISGSMLSKESSRKGATIKSNAVDIPSVNNYYAAIVSRGVLITHAGKGNDFKILKEIYRVVKPSGLCYIDYITKFNDNETRYIDTKNAYSEESMADLLNSCGFEIITFYDTDEFRVRSVLFKKI